MQTTLVSGAASRNDFSSHVMALAASLSSMLVPTRISSISGNLPSRDLLLDKLEVDLVGPTSRIFDGISAILETLRSCEIIVGFERDIVGFERVDDHVQYEATLGMS